MLASERQQQEQRRLAAQNRYVDVVCDRGCSVLLTSAGGGFIGGGEGGAFVLIDTVAERVHTFTYGGGGLSVGLPFSAYGTYEVGVQGFTTMDEFTGFGLNVNAIAVAKTGATGQVFGNGQGAIGGTTGGATGIAGNVGFLITYTRYEGSYDISRLSEILSEHLGL